MVGYDYWSDATLPEYVNTRVNELRTQRPDFQLLSFEPTMISNDIPAQKVVYTFEREEEGKTNKVMRIWSINEGKLYTLAYVAESSQYDRYLPSFQRMVDSFSIDNTTIQVEGGDRSREDNSGNGNCDRTSYPDPDVCIPPYPPDLNCPDVPYKNFKVTGSDPHGFDRDNDGIGCESSTPMPEPKPRNGDGCVEVDGYLLSEGSYLDERGRIVGSPCNPEEFCSDPDSTDPTVIDHCSDGWEEIYERCWDGTFVEDDEDCPPESEPIGYCNPGLKIIDGICGPYVPGEAYCQALGCPGSPPYPSRPVTRTPTPPVTPTPTPTDYCWEGFRYMIPDYDKYCSQTPTQTPTPMPTLTPTPPVDPSLLARSQPQCEFGINPETGLCNTEDIPSEPLAPTPEPTTTPNEEFGTEEEPEEVPAEVDEEAEEDNTSEGEATKGENQLESGNE